MMAFKDRHKTEGFTFIEITAALMIFAFLSMALMKTQMVILRRVSSDFVSVTSLIEMRNYFVELERDHKFEKGDLFRKQIEYPSIDITGKVKKFIDTSPLFIFPQGRSIILEASYDSRGFIIKEYVIGFAVAPPAVPDPSLAKDVKSSPNQSPASSGSRQPLRKKGT